MTNEVAEVDYRRTCICYIRTCLLRSYIVRAYSRAYVPRTGRCFILLLLPTDRHCSIPTTADEYAPPLLTDTQYAPLTTRCTLLAMPLLTAAETSLLALLKLRTRCAPPPLLTRCTSSHSHYRQPQHVYTTNNTTRCSSLPLPRHYLPQSCSHACTHSALRSQTRAKQLRQAKRTSCTMRRCDGTETGTGLSAGL